MTVADAILAALRRVVPESHGPVALHEPMFHGHEWDYVRDCIDTGWVSSAGAYVGRFETMLTETTGAAYAVATVNGTAALHVALQLAGVQKGDEVLIPALSFVATANAVTYCGATPHFVDSEERTLGLDPVALRDYLETTIEIRNGICWNRHTRRPIRALVPMHTFGHPVDLDGVMAVAQDFHLELVEDAAESLGSFYRGRHTGTFGRLGILSFNGNKTVTTGGGGAILTNDAELVRRAKHLTTTAKLPHRWEYVHDAVGYNYRLPNLNAALGCAQLEQLPDFLESKRRLYACYRQAFAAIPQVKLVSEPEGCRSNYWLQTLLLDSSIAGERDLVLAKTNEVGLMTRPAWVPLHRLSVYEHCPRASLLVTEDIRRRLINIPSSAGLAEAIP